MKIICHRARLNGESELDNSPEQIQKCIQLGYDVEIDLWANGTFEEKNFKLFLGHDYPKYEIDRKFLDLYSNKLWIHCKDQESLQYCINSGWNYFWHEEDDFTLTSKGYIWTYMDRQQIPMRNQVILDFSKTPNLDQNYYAICLDYVK